MCINKSSTTMCINKSFAWRRSRTSMYTSAESISRQKKERDCACKKTLRLVVEGGTRTHDLSLEDAKSKGLNNLHESVRFDVMDLLTGQNLPYFNASHQIIGGGGYKFRYNFSISHCNCNYISLQLQWSEQSLRLKAESLHCVVWSHRVDPARTFIHQRTNWQVPLTQKAQ